MKRTIALIWDSELKSVAQYDILNRSHGKEINYRARFVIELDDKDEIISVLKSFVGHPTAYIGKSLIELKQMVLEYGLNPHGLSYISQI